VPILKVIWLNLSNVFCSKEDNQPLQVIWNATS